jgi:adenine-specific DNA methylase
MSEKFQKTKPSFLEAGLPCASLSAESQRDNNARQRPPQNRLHIWWARRPPTICRAAILAGLLPHDLQLDASVLPSMIDEPSAEDLEDLPPKLQEHRSFFKRLLDEVKPTQMIMEHQNFLRAMEVTGDAAAAYRRIALAKDYLVDGKTVQMPVEWGYRHVPAFTSSPSPALLDTLTLQTRELCGLAKGEEIVLLDSMAGGGVIPLEGVRYGLKVYANDLNPVSALVLKATIEYPARYGRTILPTLSRLSKEVAEQAGHRLKPFFHHDTPSEWWPECEPGVRQKFKAQTVVTREPAGNERIQATLWLRIVPCPKCDLNIPISTNFLIVSKKGKPEASIAAFPEVPRYGQSNDCTFRIVPRAEWKDCVWPRSGFERWDPRDTPTFKDGRALCPRCGQLVDGEEVKSIARSREGGLAAQMYAVCSQVPVKLTYRNGEVKVRYLWRFRSPTQADLDAVRAAEEELSRLRSRWEAQDLIPTEEIPEGEKTKEPRNMNFMRWRDLFLPRQLLTNVVILEEIRAAQARARAELPEAEAEAVSVYLAFILSKVVNYNSVNTFWDYTRTKGAQTFSRQDFAFRAAFSEFEGARETVLWGASQVISAYEQLAGLIHGETVSLEGIADAEEGDEALDAEGTSDEEMSDEDTEASQSATAFPEHNGQVYLRPAVIVPTVTCDDAAALPVPAPGTVHLICVDPPYYNNVQYAELSNFFYVWLKRALHDWPGLAHLFREPLAESNREAVANAARWQREADAELAAWERRYDAAVEALRAQNVRVREARTQALAMVGTKPLSARERADRFYEDKMAAVFRRARQLLHPAGRMVVMFNHKETWAWRSLGMALIRAGFEIRSSAPIHTEAESSLNIRGLDAARSTVLLLCLPREETEQPVGNWGTVQNRIARVARGAAERFQKQGLTGTDLYLSALGPALGEVGRNWPVTDFAGRQIDLADALDEAYKAVGRWRLGQIFADLTLVADLVDVEEGPKRPSADAVAEEGFSVEAVDRDTQTLWLWLDTFQGETAQSDDVRKLAKSLNVDPNDFKRMGLLSTKKETFVLRPPQTVDLRLLARRLRGEEAPRGRGAREADVWEERTFPGFVGAAAWNAIALMMGADGEHRGVDAVRRWLRESGYGTQREFRGAFAVTLHLLELVFSQRPEGNEWHEAARQARRTWDLVLHSWQA